MAGHVCPWWLGYWLASPVRGWFSEKPEDLLAPYIKEGMTVLEPGPGMGFFTLPLARLVGNSGCVIPIDIQAKMLAGLARRAHHAGLDNRIKMRLARPDSMNLDDLNGTADFALAFAVVHEMPSAGRIFREAAAALKPGALLFLAEPAGHVTAEKFQQELGAAQVAGLDEINRPTVHRSRAAVLRKT